eukprot:scaffold316251_cov43-Prasinocladus_malaysianus.AAC.1
MAGGSAGGSSEDTPSGTQAEQQQIRSLKLKLAEQKDVRKKLREEKQELLQQLAAERSVKLKFCSGLICYHLLECTQYSEVKDNLLSSLKEQTKKRIAAEVELGRSCARDTEQRKARQPQS